MNNEKLPDIIDLFSGCGGLSLGFRLAGFKIASGIEMSEYAAKTASYNLYWKYGQESHHICGDVTKLSPSVLKDSVGNNGCIVIGGPPCQAYSLIGRSKLNSLGTHRAYMNDDRGQLYKDFIHYALELNARAVVMENVPESVNFNGLNIPQQACEIFEENGYDAYWTLLNAANYGVPQIRERIFVIAVKKEEEFKCDIPNPTHVSTDGRMTMNQARIKKFVQTTHFRQPPTPSPELPSWVTTKEALSDLPSLFPTSKSKYTLYKPNIQLNYKTEADNSYQHLMRNWYGKSTVAVSGHGFRKTLRDFPIFERMKPGDDYRNASLIADQLLAESYKSKSIFAKLQEDEYEKLKKEIVPPYDREKFHSKWKKLNPDLPSHTLVAHLSTDTYSHLHPWEARGISVREAARLQSFPDGFLFQVSMSESFRQIGNAVPPLLSNAIAKSLAGVFSQKEVRS